MPANNTEIETKFFVHNLERVKLRLHDLGAQVVQKRVHEKNLRFDLPDGSLRRTYRVLRLRQDENAILTYKGPGSMQDGIRAREELEVTVSDFDTARLIIEALGYQVQMFYEKFRETYALEGAHIMLDEMPYGNFVEIEGSTNAQIFEIADKLLLDKTAAICESYQLLFDRLRASRNLPFTNLSFENFAGLNISPAEMGITPADTPENYKK